MRRHWLLVDLKQIAVTLHFGTKSVSEPLAATVSLILDSKPRKGWFQLPEMWALINLAFWNGIIKFFRPEKYHFLNYISLKK